MAKKPIQLLLVDDHAMVRQGMKALLNEYEDIQVVGEAANGAKAIEMVEKLKPDVVLLDLAMPVMDGIEATKKIRAAHPHQHILVLTADPGDDKLILAIQAGAMGYLVKDTQPEELIQSIRDVYDGQPAINPQLAWKLLHGKESSGVKKQPEDLLTERESEVLRMLTRGETDQAIAKKLFLEEVTIRSHVNRIIAKLGVRNRVEAALFGIRSGMVSLDETGKTPTT